MAKTSKSQLRAKDNYEKENPEKAYYWNTLSRARGFIKPSQRSKIYHYIRRAENRGKYIDDLVDLKHDIDAQIKTLKNG